MDERSVLQQFGLTEADIDLYLLLLRNGEATASELSEKASMNRTFTYDRLKRLIEMGLASSVTKSSKRCFRPAEPQHLLSLLKEREELVKSILPRLESLRAPQKKEPKTEVYASLQGIKAALNLVFKEKKEVLIHGSISHFPQVLSSYYDIWNVRRERERIRVKALTSEPATIPYGTVDLLPEEEKATTSTLTFGTYVVTVFWSDVPVAIVIESEEIAAEHRALFNSIWEREVRIYSGADGMLRAWMELIKEPSGELVGFGFSWELAQIYGKNVSDKWHGIRLANGIPARLIAYSDKKATDYFKGRTKEHDRFDIRLLEKELCGPACITLSDHIIVTFIYTEENLRVIVSRNKETISAYRKHFESLWRKARRL